MRESRVALDEPETFARPARRGPSLLWAIVLAGGEGRRLAPLTRQIYGSDRPKQYAALIGRRSLLQQTLIRTGQLIPPVRTVIVTMATHTMYLRTELAAFPDVHVLCQPLDRGTAAAVLLAARWIHERDPAASVAVFPADHFVLEEAPFMQHVADMAEWATASPRWLVLLGAAPTGPEVEHGWIEHGENVAITASGPIRRVRCFREKPRAEIAHVLFENGGLWNTHVFAGRVSAVLDAGRHSAPYVYDPLADSRWSLHTAYRHAQTADFSRAVLQSFTCPVGVAELRNLTWSDLGTPARVADVLRKFGTSRRWIGDLA